MQSAARFLAKVALRVLRNAEVFLQIARNATFEVANAAATVAQRIGTPIDTSHNPCVRQSGFGIVRRIGWIGRHFAGVTDEFWRFAHPILRVQCCTYPLRLANFHIIVAVGHEKQGPRGRRVINRRGRNALDVGDAVHPPRP